MFSIALGYLYFTFQVLQSIAKATHTAIINETFIVGNNAWSNQVAVICCQWYLHTGNQLHHKDKYNYIELV